MSDTKTSGQPCSFCAGTGGSPTGLPCICGGSGLESDEWIELRAAIGQHEQRMAALEASLGECARWLLDHGQHTPRCPVPHAAWHSTGEACTCGLDGLVQRAEALLKETT